MRFFMIDRITRWEVGKTAEATKNVALSEDFFDDHFPKLGSLQNSQKCLGVAVVRRRQTRFQQEPGQLGHPFDHQHTGHHWPTRKMVVEEVLAQSDVLDGLSRLPHFPPGDAVDHEETHVCTLPLLPAGLPIAPASRRVYPAGALTGNSGFLDEYRRHKAGGLDFGHFSDSPKVG